MFRYLKYVLLKGVMDDMRNVALKASGKDHGDILYEKLGYRSIDEFMKAGLEEIELKKKNAIEGL